MRVGLEFGTSSCTWRTIMRVGIGSISGQGQHILDAHFFSWLDHSASCGDTSVQLWWTDWVAAGSSVTWNNTNSFGMSGFWNQNLDTEAGHANESGTPVSQGGCGPVQPDMRMEFSGSYLINVVQGTVNGSCGCLALGIKAVVENDQTKWKRFYPTDTVGNSLKSFLWVKHDRLPNTPVVQALSPNFCYQACSSPAVVRSTTPSLLVMVSDPDLGQLSTTFEIRAGASDTATLVTDNAAAPTVAASGQAASWTVPSGKLADSSTYYWRARSRDEPGLFGGWTPWQTLTVDTSPPGVTSVGSTQYPFKQWGAVVGTQGVFTLSGGSDVAEFTWSVDGGSSTTVTATGTTTKTAPVTHAPPMDLVHTLHAVAKDVAGNTGPTYDHQFWVSPVPARCWYWTLDETTGNAAAESGKAACTPTDASVSSVPGTLFGSVGFAAGHLGNAAMFTGGGIGTGQPVVDTDKSFTVAAWVQPTNLAAGDQTAVAEHGAVTSRFQLGYDKDANAGAGGWCFAMRAADSAAANPVSACATGTVPDSSEHTHPPTNDVWVHIAGVYNASTGKIQIYVMGDPDTCFGEMVEQSFAGSWTTTQELMIGRAKLAGTAAEYWTGGVDELRVYPIALSATTICQLASQ
jgi:hypothetical protein